MRSSMGLLICLGLILSRYVVAHALRYSHVFIFMSVAMGNYVRHVHMRTGRVSFGGGGVGLKTLARIFFFSIACTIIMWFCQNFT